jgi:hypothetical protein
MGETIHAERIIFKDGTEWANLTVVLEQNFIIVMNAVTGKRQEVVTWTEIRRIML